MASPNFDAIHLRLARLIEDPVSSASTDGDAITSARRSDILNEAFRRLCQKAVSQGRWDLLRDLIVTEAQSLVASVKALSGWTGGVFAILSVYNVTDEQLVNPISGELREHAVTGNNIYVLASSGQQKYSLNAGNFYLHGGTATSSIRLTYVKQHTDMTAAFASDIPLPSQYFEELLEEAARVYYGQYPSQENTVKLGILNRA